MRGEESAVVLVRTDLTGRRGQGCRLVQSGRELLADSTSQSMWSVAENDDGAQAELTSRRK